MFCGFGVLLFESGEFSFECLLLYVELLMLMWFGGEDESVWGEFCDFNIILSFVNNLN